MRIYIDGLVLVDSHFSGIGQYTLGILRGLDNDAVTNHIIRVIIPYDKLSKFNEFGFKHITAMSYPLPFKIMIRLARRRLLPPLDIFFGRAIYIFPHFVNMPLLFSKSILVVYDLSYVLHPEYSDDRNAAWLTTYVKKSLAHTDHVITISQNAKNEIVSHYGLDETMVSVAYPGVDVKHFYPRTITEIKPKLNKYGIPERFIMSLSNLEPRKNLEGLVDSYCLLSKSIRETYPLLIVGINGWKTDTLMRKIHQKQKEGFSIIQPSQYISDEDKPVVLSAATLLVFPSHYEGFGMPPLEALACGTPVITTNNSSLPEAVGSAGILVQSNSASMLAKTISTSITTIRALRARTLTDGPRHAKHFSWEKSAGVFINAASNIHESEKNK